MIKEENLFTIKEVSEKTNVHPQTLRNWEKSGLISPLQKFGNHRLFTQEHIGRIEKIQELKANGYGLKGIKEMINTKKTTKKNSVDNKYANMSIEELVDIAKEKGIKYFRQMFKEELVTALSNPKKASKMSEQAKMRTKERYGNKKYGNNQLLLASATLESDKRKTSKKELVSEKESYIENIINLYQSGKTIKEISKII